MLKNILKTSLRNLRKHPGHSFINIAGLTLGLSTLLIISIWTDFHESFDTMHEKGDKIYEVMTNATESDGNVATSSGISPKIMEKVAESTTGIDHYTQIISTWRWPSRQCFKIDETKDCLYRKGIFADSSFFHVFDFNVIKGAENPLADPKSIAMSTTLARDLYGTDDVVGEIYKIDNFREVTITAIFEDIPENSSLQFDFIAPLDVIYRLYGQKKENFDNYSFITYILVNGSEKHISDALNSHDESENLSYFLHSLSNKHLHDEFNDGKATNGLATYIEIFYIFGMFILIMSAVNFINLSTAQAAIRAKEVGVRKVNGASKSVLMAQFLLEALLKVTIAAAFSLLILYYMIPIVSAIIDYNLRLTINPEFVMTLLAIVIGLSLLAGVYPAFVLSSSNPIHALKGKEGKIGGTNGLRRYLTMAQVGFSVVILMVTCVVYLQINYLIDRNPGYDRSGVMMLEPTYSHLKQFDAFKNQLLEQSDVQGIGVSNNNITSVDYTTDDINWPGKSDDDYINFKLMGGDAGLLTVLNIPLSEGNGFSDDAPSYSEVLLSKTAAGLMKLEEPVGTKLDYQGSEVEVVGLIDDFSTESYRATTLPVIIYNIQPENSGTIYIKYNNQRPRSSIESIESVYKNYESFFSMSYRLLDEEYENMYKNERMMSRLSMIILFISTGIALIGILGLTSYNNVRRRKEMGIRKVFGAGISQIIGLLIKDFSRLTLIACMLAIPLAWYISKQWLDGFAYKIDVPYLMFIMCIGATTLIVAILIAMQSYKTSTLNPTEVMRDE